MLSWLTQLLSHYGYPALFTLLVFGVVGLPVPDETLLAFCGYLIFKGRLRFEWTLLAGFCGSAGGITISYLFGARYGHQIVARFGKYVHLTIERFERIEHRFQRTGAPLLTIGYFVPGVRHVTALVAGVSELPYRKFAIFAYLGAAIWVSSFLTMGYFLGDGWQHSSETIHKWILYLFGAGLGVGAVWLLLRRFNRK